MKITYWTAAVLLFLCMGCVENSSETSSPGGSESVPAPIPGYNLKFNFSDEQSFVLKEKHKQTMTFMRGTAMEDGVKISMTIKRKFNLSPPDKDNGINVTMTFMGMQGECTSKGEVVWAYDENGDPSGGATLPNMIGKRTDFRVDANTGQVLEVRNSEEIVNAYQKIGAEGELTQAWIRAKMNPEWYIFPDGPVEVGGSWERITKNPFEFQVQHNTTYNLTKFAEGKAVFTSSGKISPLPESERQIYPNHSWDVFGFSLSGESKGEYVINSDTGLPISRSITSTLEGDHLAYDETSEEPAKTPVYLETEAYAEYSY